MAPYLLTALMERPARLVYLTSGMQHRAGAALDDLLWQRRAWAGATAYAESKRYDTMLALAVGRRWPDIPSNAVEPGWVPTRMGGPGAPDDMDQAHRTQVWLAVGNDAEACKTGRVMRHLREVTMDPQSRTTDLQDELLGRCRALSGVDLPN